ncbi:MAG: hypothetical protein GY796_28460 [Chloroflexi bacterium]|nr:hypothetical protein [Chloroflexota bacterium]
MIKNRKNLILLAIVLIIASVGLVAFAMQPSARDMLVDALDTTETITDGHAIAEFEAEMPDESGSGTVEAWGKLDVGPNGEPAFRAEVLEASLGEFVGVTAVSDGTNFWLYNPTQNKVLTGTYEELAVLIADQMEGRDYDLPDHAEYEGDWDESDIPETSAEAVDKLLEYFTAERNGNADIGGSRALALRLIPIPEQMPNEVRAAGGYLNVWLRPADRAPLGVELAESVAGYGRIIALELEINQGVDEALFTFDIPPGTEIIPISDLELPEMESLSAEDAAAQAEIDLLAPAVLPEGATLVDTAVVRGAIVQQYSLPEGNSFTVAQGKTEANMTPDDGGEAVNVRGVDGMLFASEEGQRALLAWTENGVQFWVGGDLTPEQAMEIAESME